MKRYSFINTSVKITVLTVLGNDNLFTQRKHFYRLSFSVQCSARARIGQNLLISRQSQRSVSKHQRHRRSPNKTNSLPTLTKSSQLTPKRERRYLKIKEDAPTLQLHCTAVGKHGRRLLNHAVIFLQCASRYGLL